MAAKLTRWQRARSDTAGYGDVRRDGFIGFLGGGSAEGLLQLLGTTLPVWQQILIVAGAAGLAVFVFPALEFAWNYFRAPLRELRDDHDALEREVRELSAMVRPDPAALRVAYQDLLSDIEALQRFATTVQETGRYPKLTSYTPRPVAWKKHRTLVAQQPRSRDVVQKLDAMTEDVGEILLERSIQGFFRWNREVPSKDRLTETTELLTDAHHVVTQALERLDRSALG